MADIRVDDLSVTGDGDVNFTLLTERGKMYFRISLEALEDHFGVGDLNPLSAFEANRLAIAQKAIKVREIAERQGMRHSSQDRLILKSTCF